MSFDRKNPYMTAIKERRCLNRPGSDKKTVHLVLDISCEQLPYQVGDAIGVLPKNSPVLVAKTLQALGASGEERVFDRKREEEVSLKELLTSRRSIRKIKRSVFELIARDVPEELSDRKTLKRYLEERELWDLVLEWGKPPLQELADKLSSLGPRLYSIASSPKLHPKELHLTIGMVEYESGGNTRKGVCTEYLCEHQPLGERSVGVYIQRTKSFLLPESEKTPVIMVGPGTGIAPFRAFLQERTGMSGQNWLFFGDRHRDTDYLYEEELTNWETAGKLRLSLAFSRDQKEKRYVQHELWENRAQIWQWLEEGAHLYVCGDAKHMAPDVEQTLVAIAAEMSGQSEKEARSFVKALRKEKRYLRDVY